MGISLVREVRPSHWPLLWPTLENPGEADLWNSVCQGLSPSWPDSHPICTPPPHSSLQTGFTCGRPAPPALIALSQRRVPGRMHSPHALPALAQHQTQVRRSLKMVQHSSPLPPRPPMSWTLTHTRGEALHPPPGTYSQAARGACSMHTGLPSLDETLRGFLSVARNPNSLDL